METKEDNNFCYTPVMKLTPNIKVKKGIFALGWIGRHTAQAIYPNIYLPKTIYENLRKPNPDIKFVAILAHEECHIERQKKMGLLKWGIKSFFSPKFRFNEEIEAIKPQMEIYKKHKMKFDIEKNAKYLSSWLYFWPVSYKTAKMELMKIWNY